MIETTGVAAIAVHGRTKDERPNNDNHIDFIQEVAKVKEFLCFQCFCVCNAV